MNKKFSTLVASLLLASSVGAYAADVTAASMSSAITMKVAEGAGKVKPAVARYDEVHHVPVYQVGQAYYLGVGSTEEKVLSLSDDGLYLKVITVPSAGLGFTQSERALWVLKSLEAPAGAVAPKYVFVNKATGAVLAMDAEDALSNTDVPEEPTLLGGNVAEWLSAVSYSDPVKNSPLYAATADGKFLGLKTFDYINEQGQGEIAAVLVKMTKSQLMTNEGVAQDGVLGITPCTLGETYNSFILSAKQLNTLLGKTGDMATRSNYFSLDFDPVATVNGEENLWSQDLQAVAVEQFDVKYGTDPSESKKIVVPATADDAPTVGLGFVENENAFYASLRPLWDSNLTSYTADCFNKIAQEGPYEAVDNNEARWLTVRNRDNKYLVVDTTYIKGTNTSQLNNGLITFAWDGLYNTQNDTRRRDPRSYLFQFIYNPVTEQIQVMSMAHAEYNDDPIPTSTNVETWHASGNKEQFVKAGMNWYFADNADENPSLIVHAGLGATHEVTLATDEDLEEEDLFSIKLSLSKYMTPSSVATGAYLIKEVASGKYWVTNLAGEFELVEQAPRQNFQDMPSAQWIVKSAGTTAGSPVLWIANREFGSEPDRVSSGTLFENARGKYFAGSATLEFIPVENTKDSHLGYKYVANDTIRESLFSFNYLHDLAMDKPINTLNDKDSALWVDANGNKMSFVLERVLDDTYGFNGDIDGIAELTRTAYRIKVNDATKLQNDGRYLTYDPSVKKFVVSTADASAINLFWLKENNEVKGGECYYTFLKANVWPVVGVKGNRTEGYNITKRPGYVAMDQSIDDCDGLYLAEYGKYTSSSDGIVNGTEGWTLRIFTKSQAYAFLANYPELVAADFLKVVSVEDAKINSVNGEYGEATFDRENMYVIAVALTEAAEGEEELLVIENDGRYNYDTDVTNYAISKVSVDNNTLALVNGVLEDAFYAEVANSAFSVVRNADPLYRHFTEPQVVKFFRTNASAPEYLYEDANSSYSAGLGFNFLGVEGKGDQKNAAMYLDTAYVDRGTRMPQYLIALAPTVVEGDTVLCDATTHQHATVEEALACDHSKTTRGYITARYLVNLQDSVVAHQKDDNYSLRNKFIYDKNYTRLGFVEATHIGDSLIIKNSAFTGNTDKLEAGKAATVASQDTINLANNLHKNAVFSFRIAKSGSDDFLIESETEGLNNAGTAYENKKNADLKAARIAPEKGGWLKIQNGVPVIANSTYSELGLDADIFNVEATDEDPTANEAVEAAEVSVVAVNGAIIVKGAAGKVVTVANVLGQTIANQVAASDNVTIAAPAGVAIVTVDGEATKVIVK